MKSDRVVDLKHIGGGYRQFGTGLAVLVVVVRYDGVETVISPRQLDDDQDGVAARRFGERGAGQKLGDEPPQRQDRRSARQLGRKTGSGALLIWY